MFPLKDIYEETCRRDMHFGDDTDVNLTRQGFSYRKVSSPENIGFWREVILVPASAMKDLITTTLYCNSSHD